LTQSDGTARDTGKVRYYYRITDPAVRKNVFEMAKILTLSKSS